MHQNAYYIALMHASFLAVPGAPQNVRAAEVSEPTENVCIILVQWDPPANTDQSDIDHYIVYVPSRNIISDAERSTISVLRVRNCRDGIHIQVAAVNRGCIGPTSSEVQPSLLLDIIQTTEGRSTTITPTEGGSTTTTPTEGPNALYPSK